MTHLVVGCGEVGRALATVLGGGGSSVFVYDRVPVICTWTSEPVDWVHVCVPWSDGFDALVRQWIAVGPVIVHSTVPLGTCDALGVVHSPVRGAHPELVDGIRTFIKYFGGSNAPAAAAVFRQLGIAVRVFPTAKTTEAIKLWDTTQYGRLILLEKEIYAWCEAHGVDFQAVYRDANRDYNDGYVALGRPEVVRPWLRHVPGPIGGHCVQQNMALLFRASPSLCE